MAATAAPFIWYDKGLKNINLYSILTDDIKVALITSGYTPNVATHEFFDVSITNEHGTSSGYTVGGLALASKTLTSTVAGEWKFDSIDPAWTVAGTDLTAKMYVLYNNTPASNKPLLGYGYLNWNGGTPLDVTTVVGFTETLILPAAGWFKTAKTNGA